MTNSSPFVSIIIPCRNEERHIGKCLDSIIGRERAIVEAFKRLGIHSLETKKILDIGCGAGGELRNLIRYGAQPENLYDIDLLPERIDMAKMISPGAFPIFVNQKKADHKGSALPCNTCRSAGGLSPAQYLRHILQKIENTPLAGRYKARNLQPC